MLSMLRLQYELLENMYGVEIEFDEELYLDFTTVMNLLGEKALITLSKATARCSY